MEFPFICNKRTDDEDKDFSCGSSEEYVMSTDHSSSDADGSVAIDEIDISDSNFKDGEDIRDVDQSHFTTCSEADRTADSALRESNIPDLNVETSELPPSQKKVCRRKKSNPNSWKRTIKAKARSAGKQYTTATGKVVKAKRINTGTLCTEKCRFNCSLNVSIDQREYILQKYYKLNLQAKNVFICKSLKKKPIHRRAVN